METYTVSVKDGNNVLFKDKRGNNVTTLYSFSFRDSDNEMREAICKLECEKLMAINSFMVITVTISVENKIADSIMVLAEYNSAYNNFTVLS